MYGTLCALASMSRNSIKVNYHESDTFSYFLEQEPYTRELLSAYMNNKFKTVLDILEKQSVSPVDHTFDSLLSTYRTYPTGTSPPRRAPLPTCTSLNE